jgi:hypothetical protein
MKSSHVALEIRRGVPGEATAIVRARREAILSKGKTHYDLAILNDWADAMGASERVARIERKILDPGFVVLVAEAGDEIIGFGMADLPNNELQALYTKSNQIGKVGQLLLAALEQLAFETVPFLGCDASLNAESFYKANGYTEECRKDHVARPGGVVSRVVQMKKHRPNAGPG